jgi:hypothetical protein
MCDSFFSFCKDSNPKQTSSVTLLSIRAWLITTLKHDGSFIPLPTAAPKSMQDNIRCPHIDYWLSPKTQAYVHRVIAHVNGERFAIHFKRHRSLPRNTSLNINGNILIMRMGKINSLNPVNMKVGKHGDAKKARAIAKKW